MCFFLFSLCVCAVVLCCLCCLFVCADGVVLIWPSCMQTVALMSNSGRETLFGAASAGIASCTKSAPIDVSDCGSLCCLYLFT